MKITQIQPQKNDPKRVNLFIDEKFCFSLPLLEAVKMNLKVGLEIDQKALEKLWSENLHTYLKDSALNYLSYRPHSKKEVVDHILLKLRNHKLKNELKIKLSNEALIIDDVISYLVEQGFINDTNFAKWWVEQRRSFGKKGKKFIEFELKQKGVEDKIIKEIFNDDDKNSDTKVAFEYLLKKTKNIEKFDKKDQKNKMYMLLKAKGFDYEDIKNAIDMFLGKD